ncbi:ras-related protein Rab-22A-like isoform X1 [Amphiura filiformis]|uniref:ras-related protein Rab-22A-like isoform X1 n=1 Tax=Amphiura filiformis TaxID=82378 RepID=UPI003B2218CF
MCEYEGFVLLHSEDMIRKWKLCIVGETGVGKTSILMRYKDDAFFNGSTTIGAAYSKVKLDVDGITHRLDVWDTAGQERFRSLAPIYYRGCSAAILVFSVDNMESFRKVVDYWMPAVKNHGKNERRNIITCIVGNKADLKQHRQISTEEAETFAIRTDSIYFETSAKTGDNVNQLFLTIARRVTSEMSEEQTELSSLIHLTNQESEEVEQRSCC